jgi:hypothetical protein
MYIHCGTMKGDNHPHSSGPLRRGGHDRWEGRRMERTTTLVREYDTEQDFHTDELTLSRQGWSVEPTANLAPKLGVLARIRARFSRTPTPERLVVTYTRQRPA